MTPSDDSPVPEVSGDTRIPAKGDNAALPVAPGPEEKFQKVVVSIPADHFGTTIYLKAWTLPDSTRHPVLIIHDLGEHAGLYADTALEFLRAGYPVYAFDLRGHGRSGRRLGHAPSYNILIRDLLQVAAWVRHKEHGRAPVLVGQGIGALIVTDFTKRHGNFCKAAVLSAPCFDLQSQPTLGARFWVWLLAELMPNLRLPSRLSPAFARDLCSIEHHIDPEETSIIVPFPRLTAVFTQELLLALQRAEAHFIEYHGKVLILCPAQDEVCNYTRLRKAVALHNEDNIRLVDIPDATHCLYTDTESKRQDAVNLILRWMDETVFAPDGPRSLRPDLRIQGASRSGDEDDLKPGATSV